MNTLQRTALKFAFNYPNWHGFTNDRKTVEAICGLHNCGLVIVNKHNKFKITEFGKSQEQMTDKEYNKQRYPFYY